MKGADCLPIFIGDELDLAIASFWEGDTIVIVNHAVLGERKKDVSERLSKLAVQGCLVQVVGGEPVLYDTEEKVDEFASLAMLAKPHAAPVRRKKRGPRGKLDDVTPDHLDTIDFLWFYKNGVKQQVAVDYCHRKGYTGITRNDLWNYFNAQAKAKLLENDQEG